MDKAIEKIIAEAQRVELTVEEARSIETGIDKLDEAIDEAQGPVFAGDEQEAWVLITIKKA